jgi:hypothetical protein
MADRIDKPLAGNKGVVLAMYDAESFGRDAAMRFPEHARQFEEDLELLHVHMATLAGIARDALAAKDLAKVRDVGAFLDDALKHPRAISEIEVAVAISFVDVREFRTHANGELALQSLPTRVRQILLEQDRRESEGP